MRAAPALSNAARLGCDAFDAMASEQPYSRALHLDEAIAELRSAAGRQFDPAVVAVLVAFLRERFRPVIAYGAATSA